jgi:ribonuclease BN (tRNA processing enzyme)
MKVRFLGTHNSESKTTKLVTILIDNKLSIDAGCLASQLTFLEQRRIKAILLTHGHYDHIREVPAFAFNNIDHTTKVYGTMQTLDILKTHLVDGVIYPEFTKKIPFFLEKPSLKFITITTFKKIKIDDYQVLPLPVNHTINSVGYEITSKNGKKIFYTGDTSSGLSSIWKIISPDLLIIDLTFPDNLEKRAENSGHLCPKLLRKELIELYQVKNKFPEITLIHLNPKFEDEIKTEIRKIEKDLKITINLANEGEEINL